MKASEFTNLMARYKVGYHNLSNTEIISAHEFFSGCAYSDWENKRGIVPEAQACYMLGYQCMCLNGEWDVLELNNCKLYWKYVTLAPDVPKK
jgi:hypothetical protein